MKRRSKRLAAAMLVCAAAVPGSAAGWDRPLTLGEQIGFGPYVAVDQHGVTRVLRGVPRGNFEVVALRRGSRHPRRCRVPGRRAGASDPGFRWAAGPSGATVLVFNERTGVEVTSSRAGGCFRRPRVVSHGRATVGSVAIGAGGTAVATFGEAHGRRPARTVFASGPAGGTLRRRGTVVPARFAGMFPEVIPAFVRGDRLLWTMRVFRRSGERYVHQLFAALGGSAARPGRFRAVSRPVQQEARPDLPFVSDVFTNPRGGQVAATFGDGYVSVFARRPGRAFGAPRTFATGQSEFENEGAINARGDSVLAWESEDDVYALVRRRSGRLLGPQLLTPGDAPRVAEQPAVAIDGRGRAIVAWLAQDSPAEQSAPAEVRVAAAGPGGRFGGSRVISGSRRAGFSIPMDVAVNARGEAAVTFMRERVDPAVGVVSAKTIVVRGHTSR